VYSEAARVLKFKQICFERPKDTIEVAMMMMMMVMMMMMMVMMMIGNGSDILMFMVIM